MRIGFLALCLVGLTVGLNGQTGVQAPGVTFFTPDATIHAAGRVIVSQQGSSTFWVGQNVSIRVGSTVITAESAVIDNWVAGGAQSIRSIQLKGNVEMKGTVSVE